MDNLVQYVQDGFMWLGVIITAATAIVAALEKVAAVTPTTKDDEYVSKAKYYLSLLAKLLDKLSVWDTKK